MHTYIHIYIHTYIHTCINTYIHTYIPYMYTLTNLYTSILMHTNKHYIIAVAFAIPVEFVTPPSVPVPLHLYGEVARTPAGAAWLRASGHLAHFAAVLDALPAPAPTPEATSITTTMAAATTTTTTVMGMRNTGVFVYMIYFAE